jgi:hypothetical protein
LTFLIDVPVVTDVKGGTKGLAIARPPPFMCWNEAWERSDQAECKPRRLCADAQTGLLDDVWTCQLSSYFFIFYFTFFV